MTQEPTRKPTPALIENLIVGRGTAVHVAYGDLPRCDTGAGARGGSSRKTTDPVTCRRCLKLVPTANQAETTTETETQTPTPAQHSPYAQVVRVHADGRRIIVVTRDSFYGAEITASRLNASLTADDHFRFEVEREGFTPDVPTTTEASADGNVEIETRPLGTESPEVAAQRHQERAHWAAAEVARAVARAATKHCIQTLRGMLAELGDADHLMSHRVLLETAIERLRGQAEMDTRVREECGRPYAAQGPDQPAGTCPLPKGHSPQDAACYEQELTERAQDAAWAEGHGFAAPLGLDHVAPSTVCRAVDADHDVARAVAINLKYAAEQAATPLDRAHGGLGAVAGPAAVTFVEDCIDALRDLLGVADRSRAVYTDDYRAGVRASIRALGGQA